MPELLPETVAGHDDLFADSSSAQRRPPPFNPIVLLRYKWTILLVFLVIAGAAVPAIWFTVVPKYQAKALVQVASYTPRVAFSTEENGVMPRYEAFVNTQCSTIQGYTVIERVLDRAEVRATEWYKRRETTLLGLPVTPRERLPAALAVQPLPKTELIQIAMTAVHPGDARTIVNAVVEEFMKFCEERSGEDVNQKLKALRQKIEGAESRLAGYYQDKQHLLAEHGAFSSTELQAQLAVQLASLRGDLRALEHTRAMTQRDYEKLLAKQAENATQKPQSGEPSSSQPAERQFGDDAEWRAMNTALEHKRLDLARTRERFGDSHQRIRDLVEEIKLAEKLLADHELNLQARWRSPAAEAPRVASGAVPRSPEAVRELLDRIGDELALRQQELQTQRGDILAAGVAAEKFEKLNEQIRGQREFIDTLTTRQTQLQTEVGQFARISVANPAFEPNEPERDRRPMFCALAVVMALGAGVGASYLRLISNKSVMEPLQVTSALHAPFLGRLPDLTRLRRLPHGESIRAEHVRMVRTALLERIGDGKSATVLITSAGPLAGKTTFAMQLAESLAKLGKKVLLIDGDLRRPAIAARLGLRDAIGLTSLLHRRVEDREAIVSVDNNGFNVLPAGKPISECDPELLASGVFAACLERWRARYDVVVMDSAPLLPVADSRMLSRLADGTVMVVRASRCRRDEVVQAHAELSAAGGRLFGTVLVGGADQPAYGVGYRGYYGAYAPELPDGGQRPAALGQG